MWRSTGIRNRFDGSKIVFAIEAGNKASKALKVLVLFGAIATFGMKVNAFAIDLPDFDAGGADRVTFLVGDFSRLVRDLTNRRCDRIVED